jgi:hypothetical protein
MVLKVELFIERMVNLSMHKGYTIQPWVWGSSCLGLSRWIRQILHLLITNLWPTTGAHRAVNTIFGETQISQSLSNPSPSVPCPSSNKTYPSRFPCWIPHWESKKFRLSKRCPWKRQHRIASTEIPPASQHLLPYRAAGWLPPGFKFWAAREGWKQEKPTNLNADHVNEL